MTDAERDALLVRLDERTDTMRRDMDEYKKIVDIVKNHVSDIKLIKWIGTTAISIGGLLIGALEYFKK